ncbi:MAG: hypothetical protein GXP26_14940 [Planctomycetes bacterium]|nr:hypothetical protein [Planctomycetota bacterium]
MKKAVTLLQKMASGRAVLGLFVLTTAVYLAMLFYTIPKVASFAPGIALFDLSPTGYSHEHAVTLLESLGQEGRNVYLYQQLPVDFIYPGLFAVSNSLLLTWLFVKRFEANSKIFYLAMVPVLGGLFDYLENISIVRMIQSFPDISQELVATASTFTILKSAFITAFFVVLLLGVATLRKRELLAEERL